MSLDRFKEKNDRFGSEVGDQLLKGVARRLIAIIGDRDTVTRWGGDEFVVLREGIKSDADGSSSAPDPRLFDDPFAVGLDPIYAPRRSASRPPSPGELTIDDVLRHADAACQMAKQQGGAALHLFDAEMRAPGAAARGDRRRASRRGRPGRARPLLPARGRAPHHRDHRCRGAPAVAPPRVGPGLAGRVHPGGGDRHVILEIGEWVLCEAMLQCREWRARFPDRPADVAINLSPKQFVQDDFVETVAGCWDHAAPTRATSAWRSPRTSS